MRQGFPSKRLSWSDSRKPSITPADVLDQYPSSILPNHQQNRFEILSTIGLVYGAKQNFAPICFDASSGRSTEELRMAAATASKVNPCCLGAEGETSMEISYGRALAKGLSDVRYRRQVIPNQLSELPQGHCPNLTSNGNIDDLLLDHDFLDNRLFRELWKRVNGFDGRLDFFQRFWNVSVSTNSALVVPSPSVAVDKIFLMPSIPWMASSILMQTPCSTSLGAAPRYTTLTEIMSELTDGKTLPFPRPEPHQSSYKNTYDQQVGRNMVSCKPINYTIHGPTEFSTIMGRTFAPSKGISRNIATTRSPSLIPPIRIA